MRVVLPSVRADDNKTMTWVWRVLAVIAGSLVLTGALQLGAGAAAPRPPLVLSGDLAGLVPGHDATLTVAVRNSSSSPVPLTAIEVDAHPADPGCPPDALVIAGYQGHEVVAPHAVVHRVLRAHLRPDVRCSSWDLRYTAR